VHWLKTEIPRLMAGVAHLKVPLLAEVGVGLNWDKAHLAAWLRFLLLYFAPQRL
jgi:hypothetical protein